MQGTIADSVDRLVVLSDDYLSLRAVSLRSGEEWVPPGKGLAFVFPTEGTGKYVSGVVSHALSVGHAAVMISEIGGRVCASERCGFSFSFFTVCLEDLYPLFARHELQWLPQVEDRFRRNGWRFISGAVAAECTRLLKGLPAGFSLEHRGQLLRIAAVILAGEVNDVRPRAEGYVRMEDHVCQVFEKLSLEELLNLSVGELASRFGCSRRHLNRLFHQYFGLPVASLRMELRMLKAVSLLRDPSAKVLNVAEQCGFNHLGLFGTCFKRRFGVSPGQWRSQAMEPAEEGVRAVISDDPACQLAQHGLCPWHCMTVKGFPLMPSAGQSHPPVSRLSGNKPANENMRSRHAPRVLLSPSRPNLKILVHG